MAKRKQSRKTTRSRQARHGSRKPAPAWMWLVAGILIGLGLATTLLLTGNLPGSIGELNRTAETVPQPGSTAKPAADEPPEDEEPIEQQSRYDFYTVLPEMEVVIPEEEIHERAAAREEASRQNGPYLLQVGSFQSGGDAEQVKAQLALFGLVAQVQSVEINNTTWHRVRLGPYQSAREVDRIQRQLADNGMDAITLKGQPE